MKKVIFTVLALALFACGDADAEPQQNQNETENSQDNVPAAISRTLVNPNATAEAQQLYAKLRSIYGTKALSGVVADIDWNYREAENVHKWTGKWPAINVFDFINIHASKDVNPKGWLDYSDMTPVNEWHQAGGIVGAMWHWQVKANNGTNMTCSPGGNASETSFDPSQVYVDGTAENRQAIHDVDQVAGYLKTMQKKGIPVIWRPLHEAAGNTYEYEGGRAWFWWGAKGADAYKKLWRWMYNRLVSHHGLNNLIWVWTAQTGDESWYPGDDVVDIVGRDNYAALMYPLMKEFNQLTQQYPTKMITLAECGNGDEVNMSLWSKIWQQGSRWSWFMTWYDHAYNEGNSEEHQFAGPEWWKDAFNSGVVLDREEWLKVKSEK
ncbi:MAG: beta-mannosidase [Prevotella sp.]|nr:beta-mannosidase [Prevotella sp.]